MSVNDWMFAAVDAVLWYAFLYYFLFSVKNSVNLYKSAFILLVLMYAAFIVCPWFRNTPGWIALFG